MKKLLAVLIAGLFTAGAFAQAPAAPSAPMAADNSYTPAPAPKAHAKKAHKNAKHNKVAHKKTKKHSKAAA